MTTQSEQHQQLIREQFTQQAVPFANLPEHTETQAMNLLLEACRLTGKEIVLDVACGPGLVACEVAKKAPFVTGVDLTPAMIEQAKKRQMETGLNNLNWHIVDGTMLPFEADHFSRVITRYSFHHFLEPASILLEMVRVCRPGGKVVVMDVFTPEEQHRADLYDTMEKLRDPSHTHALKLSEFQAIFEVAKLQNIEHRFCRLHMTLENLLANSFPNPGDADKLRQMFEAELENNLSGFEPYRNEQGDLRFSFPIVIMSGDNLH